MKPKKCISCGSKSGFHKKKETPLGIEWECKGCGVRSTSHLMLSTQELTQKESEQNVLIIGDAHLPFVHPRYLDFLYHTAKQWDCTKIINIGDLVDNHALNYHEFDPDGMNGKLEVDRTRIMLKEWQEAFPDMDILVGNHDALPLRKAKTHGIPSQLIKPYNEIWDLPPTWRWHISYEFNGVKYQHGTGRSGKLAHINWAIDNRQSTVTGHTHAYAGVEYLSSAKDTIFGLGVGCGINEKEYAFAYARDFSKRPVLGCGVVTSDKTGFFIPMKI
jgi:hypothetical protein